VIWEKGGEGEDEIVKEKKRRKREKEETGYKCRDSSSLEMRVSIAPVLEKKESGRWRRKVKKKRRDRKTLLRQGKKEAGFARFLGGGSIDDEEYEP